MDNQSQVQELQSIMGACGKLLDPKNQAFSKLTKLLSDTAFILCTHISNTSLPKPQSNPKSSSQIYQMSEQRERSVQPLDQFKQIMATKIQKLWIQDEKCMTTVLNLENNTNKFKQDSSKNNERMQKELQQLKAMQQKQQKDIENAERKALAEIENAKAQMKEMEKVWREKAKLSEEALNNVIAKNNRLQIILEEIQNKYNGNNICYIGKLGLLEERVMAMEAKMELKQSPIKNKMEEKEIKKELPSPAKKMAIKQLNINLINQQIINKQNNKQQIINKQNNKQQNIYQLIIYFNNEFNFIFIFQFAVFINLMHLRNTKHNYFSVIININLVVTVNICLAQQLTLTQLQLLFYVQCNNQHQLSCNCFINQVRQFGKLLSEFRNLQMFELHINHYLFDNQICDNLVSSLNSLLGLSEVRVYVGKGNNIDQKNWTQRLDKRIKCTVQRQ